MNELVELEDREPLAYWSAFFPLGSERYIYGELSKYDPEFLRLDDRLIACGVIPKAMFEELRGAVLRALRAALDPVTRDHRTMRQEIRSYPRTRQGGKNYTLWRRSEDRINRDILAGFASDGKPHAV
jgi:hypothetical protein